MVMCVCSVFCSFLELGASQQQFKPGVSLACKNSGRAAPIKFFRNLEQQQHVPLELQIRPLV
jgi:hypothetical protein